MIRPHPLFEVQDLLGQRRPTNVPTHSTPLAVMVGEPSGSMLCGRVPQSEASDSQAWCGRMQKAQASLGREVHAPQEVLEARVVALAQIDGFNHQTDTLKSNSHRTPHRAGLRPVQFGCLENRRSVYPKRPQAAKRGRKGIFSGFGVAGCLEAVMNVPPGY